MRTSARQNSKKQIVQMLAVRGFSIEASAADLDRANHISVSFESAEKKYQPQVKFLVQTWSKLEVLPK